LELFLSNSCSDQEAGLATNWMRPRAIRKKHVPVSNSRYEKHFFHCTLPCF
jgi:hypothetical protein